MSNSDQEQKERRRQRRRQAKSAQTVRSNEPDNSSHYAKLLEDRLRKAELLPVDGRPIVAKQLRHINNYQHAIPFRQEFTEQLLEHFQEIDRQIEVDRKKQIDKNDRENARIRRQLEKVHQKKVRELELYNNRDFVRKLLEEHLKNSTPQAQLHRIKQLEDELHQLRQEHNKLVERVNQNERKCDENKHEHDDEINGIKKRFEDYRKEIDEYRRRIERIIANLEEKLENLNKKQEILNEKQEEHEISIKDLSLQRNILNKLTLQIEQIINARRDDLDKLDKFTRKLDDLKDLLNQIREGLHPLNRIPFLEREIEEIRNLLNEPNIIEDLETRVRQIEQVIIRHNDQLGIINGQLNTFEATYQSLKDRIDYIKNNDLRAIENRLQSINNDLATKTIQISEANELARNAVDQVNELRQLLDSIKNKFTDLDNLIRDLGDIRSRLNDLEAKSNNSDIQAVLDELRNKLKELVNIATELDNLKRRVDDLEKLGLTTKESIRPDTHDRRQMDLEDYFQRIKKEILEPLFNSMQQINIQINEAKALINDLRTQFNQLLNKQSEPPPPPIVQPNVSSKRKLIPYIESLPPIDLLDDIWS